VTLIEGRRFILYASCLVWFIHLGDVGLPLEHRYTISTHLTPSLFNLHNEQRVVTIFHSFNLWSTRLFSMFNLFSSISYVYYHYRFLQCLKARRINIHWSNVIVCVRFLLLETSFSFLSNHLASRQNLPTKLLDHE
jgi:hypothetical protein